MKKAMTARELVHLVSELIERGNDRKAAAAVETVPTATIYDAMVLAIGIYEDGREDFIRRDGKRVALFLAARAVERDEVPFLCLGTLYDAVDQARPASCHTTAPFLDVVHGMPAEWEARRLREQAQRDALRDATIAWFAASDAAARAA